MPSSIRVYRIKQFIRFDEEGVIDLERSKQLVHQIATLAGSRNGENILLDLRDTTIASVTMGDILEIASEFTRYEATLGGKIANIIPNDEVRIFLANRLKELLHIHIDPSRYEVFTNFERAIDWLSHIEDGSE